MAAIIVLGYLAVFGIAAWTAHGRIVAEAERSAYNTASLLEALIAQAVEEIDRVIAHAAEQVDGDGAADGGFQAALPPTIQALAVVDPNGRLIHGDPVLGARLASLAGNGNATADRLSVGPPEQDAAGRWTIVFHRPVIGADGRRIGTAGALVPTRVLDRVFGLVDLTALGTIGVNLLDGTLLLRAPHQDEWIGFRFDQSQLFTELLPARPGGTGTIVYNQTDNSRRLVAYQTVRNAPMVVAVTRPWPDILADWQALALSVALFGAAVTVAAPLLVGVAALQMRRRQAAELARQAAEAENDAKSRFLAVMSHELRTPLNAIGGFSQMIEGERLGPVGHPRYREYARDIHTSAEHLSALVGDMLEMSKAEAGVSRLDEAEVALGQIVADAARMLETRAHAKRVALHVAPPEGLKLRADPRALRQVLINLLANAVKFTPPGGEVSVDTEIVAGGDVVLRVRDTGIGIPADELPGLGRPFVRGSNAARGQAGGTGLGLAISRSLVELHGGTLVLESVEGQGTQAQVRLPARRVLARA